MDLRAPLKFPPESTERPELELAVIVPTFNEGSNVNELLRRLDRALQDVAWEVIFVDDDSSDGTAELLRKIGLRSQHVRVIQRIGRRGLSSAVIEGMLATPAPYLAVIDGDLQHDESLLANMLAAARDGGYDLVVGSRYMAGGSAAGLSKSRRIHSRLGTKLSSVLLAHEVSDPMSGFFLITRPAFERVVRDLSGIGFKILLDIVMSSPKSLKINELPYEFRARQLGESKLDSVVLWQFLVMILDKKMGWLVPARFILFGLVGCIGLGVHMTILWLGLSWAGLRFAVAQGVATAIAMTSNYVLNNSFTHRDRRRTGVKFLTGLLSFYAICAVGAVANVGIAEAIYQRDTIWWVSGLAGALVGSVWNYALSAVFTWRK